MREVKKILQDEMAHLVGITSKKLKRAINRVSASEFVGDYKLLETIVKRITVKENHDAGFAFIDGSKAKKNIEGTGKIRVHGKKRSEPKYLRCILGLLKRMKRVSAANSVRSSTLF